jgi:GMP synthase (glutamine-hydrolysing)
MVGTLSDDDVDEIRAAGARHLPGLVPAAEKMFAGFGELVRARG